MRNKLLFLCFLHATFWAAGGQAQQPASLPTVVENQLIVGFVPGTPGIAMADAHRQAGATESTYPTWCNKHHFRHPVLMLHTVTKVSCRPCRRC